MECDDWLPVIGRMDVMDVLERLKVMMEDCMLRVFQGIIASRQRKAHQYKKPLTYDGGREDESGDEEEENLNNTPLSDTEVKELGLMTMDVVRILNHYSTYRVAMQSQSNSRPGTPMDSPSLASVCSHRTRLTAVRVLAIRRRTTSRQRIHRGQVRPVGCRGSRTGGWMKAYFWSGHDSKI